MVNGAKPNWDVLFDAIEACVDGPSAHYWRELIVAYPDAKVLLAMRSAESWWTGLKVRS